MSHVLGPNGPAPDAVGTAERSPAPGGSGGSSPRASTVSLQWRSSRHARLLLTLGLAALFVATVARRPEFAGLAAPALLLLAAGRSQPRPPRISLGTRPSTRRAFEGELVAIDLVIAGSGRRCGGRCTRAGKSKLRARPAPRPPTGRRPASPSPRSAGVGARSAPWTWCCVTAGDWPKGT